MSSGQRSQFNSISVRPSENKLDSMSKLELIIRNGRVQESSSKTDNLSVWHKQQEKSRQAIARQITSDVMG
jgi:hypothetical protein